MIVSCKMNDIDPHAWLADVLDRIAAHPAHRIDELLPWNWKMSREESSTASRRLNMQRNKVHAVTVIAAVAKQLGVDEDLLHKMSVGLEPEDGVIWVYGINEDAIKAFTEDGIEELKKPSRDVPPGPRPVHVAIFACGPRRMATSRDQLCRICLKARSAA